jgi:3-oxoacyl-[acyl-carrier protein] reductase
VLDVRFPGLAGKVAVVSGAARGIGRSIADELVGQGCRVAYLDVAAVDPPPADGGLAVQCDVSDEVGVERAIAEVEERLGPVDILVNNAGIIRVASLAETDLDTWRRVLDVNVTGAFLLARRCVPGMNERGFGRVINIGSNSGKMGGASNVVAYAASKAALHNLARSIASEQARHGVTANAIAACLIDTDMAQSADLDEIARNSPMGRLGSPQDIAYAALFLAAPEAAYITGEVMDVNGGYYID